LVLLLFGKQMGFVPEIIDQEQNVIRSYERFIALAPVQYKEQIDPLIKKIRGTIEKARSQLAVPKNNGMDISCYLLLNLTSNIGFFHKMAFRNKLTDLKNEYSHCGLEILTEEAPYL